MLRTRSFAGAALACLVLGFATAVALAATNTVRPDALDGWVPRTATCGAPATSSQAFVTGPETPPEGTGSVYFAIGANGDSLEEIRNTSHHGTRLDSLTALEYSTYVETPGTGGQATYIILNIDNNGDTTGDDLIFFEPEYQNGHRSTIPQQEDVAVGQWQTWNALYGGWWSLNGVAGAAPGASVKTLQEYLAAQPNARIINGSTGLGGIRLVNGCGGAAWAGFEGNADRFVIGVRGQAVTVHDFEPAAPAEEPPPEETGTTTTTTETTTVTTTAPAPTYAPQPKPGNCANLTQGTSANDTLEGTGAGDRLVGLAGDDRLTGGASGDCLYGGEGEDLLTGGDGNDFLSGEAARDILTGGIGNDALFGGNGNDSLDGGPGHDRLYGRNGNDVLSGSTGNDVLSGGPGRDTISGGSGTNRILSGSGNDVVNSANGKRERINCGPGRDRVRADRRDVLSGCEFARRS